MKHTALVALAFVVALLFGGAYAGEDGGHQRVAAKKQCKKDTKGKCTPVAKPVKKHKKKRKPKPLAPVSPTIEKGYRPPFFSTSPRMQLAVAAYKACMYGDGGGDNESERVERAVALNLSYRGKQDLSGSMEKIGREVCLADALGLRRYETQEEVDRAKGSELVEISGEFIEFPDDEGSRLPSKRRFARAWVKSYVETLARDLHTYLLSKRPKGSVTKVPLLRATSFVRTLDDQAKLGSPAKCKNEICSTHLTGSTVDIANSPNRVSEDVRRWIRKRLLEDRRDGKIVMIQEFKMPHYHIFVLPPEFVPGKQLEE